MEIKFVPGSIFNSPAELLINPVNKVGVMGAGLAKEFKKRYPLNFEDYKTYCTKHHVSDKQFLCLSHENGKSIYNFPSKNHFRDPSTLKLIRKALITLVTYLTCNQHVKSIAFPPVGCGLGGLDQRIVLHLICYYIRQVPHDITVYLYGFTEIKPFYKNYLLTHYDLSYREQERYAGVGNRDTTINGNSLIQEIAVLLDQHGYDLSTGDASKGADEVFWTTSTSPYKRRYGPVGKAARSDTIIVEPNTLAYKRAQEISSRLHPKWRWVSQPIRELHIRNVFELLGDQADQPVEFMVCWTKDRVCTASETSKKTGGTGQAIRIAEAFGIPIFNINSHYGLHGLIDYLNISEENGRPINMEYYYELIK